MSALKLPGLIFLMTLLSCDDAKQEDSLDAAELPANNMLATISDRDLGVFKWMNAPESFSVADNSIQVIADKGTDFFNNPEDLSITATAPLLYQDVNGDFVLNALVKPDFSSMWNAVSLMVFIDDANWIKFAFENSDATGKSIVTVVTKGVSDDANGAVLSELEQVWLKLIRKENIYSMLWSADGHQYKMARLTSMPVAETIKVGVEFQSPVGDPASHQLNYFSLTKTTVADLRKGE